MNTPIGLSPQEVEEVTGYKRPKKQAEALQHMGIPFTPRLNGTIFVARQALATASTATTGKPRQHKAVIEDF